MDAAVKQERLQNRLGPEIKEFRDNRKTVQLATVDADGCPNVSYAPFALLPDGYYVLISEIARHARNLKVNPQVSLMMVEDEEGAREIYARQRLTFDANAELVERSTEQWKKGIEALQARFGGIIEGLSGLEDFKLFRLVPQQGLYVKGFGKAFQVSGSDLIDAVHLDQGHQRIEDGSEVKDAEEAL